ncbi:hypothetical protein, variant 1 [Aphanomyces astaci]|nr:hypothetical protein, variant 1 [Aphanomyces astaci]ETV77086.1 hypothetical protein, variant 1 [Aphanomyces astaci]|eukprot:XP_009833392.1 hypothetical protein, variant 1 [Aphanomyces astaci]
MPYGQPRQSNMFGTAPTLQAGPSGAAQNETRGRSFGGGASSFSPFTHEGQGQYHNPYDINPASTSNPVPPPPSTSGGFHSMGGSNKRRGQGCLGGGQSYEVPRMKSPVSFTEPPNHGGNLYGHQPLPQTAQYHQPTQPMAPATYQQPQWQQQPQHCNSGGYAAHQPPPLWNKFEGGACYNNNFEPQHYEAAMPSENVQQASSQRPHSSRSTLGSAGAMAMLTSQDELSYNYTDNNQRQPTSYAPQHQQQQPHRPDIYHHMPSSAAPSPSKPSLTLQWSGTGSYGHSSTRVSRPPGGHSQFALG